MRGELVMAPETRPCTVGYSPREFARAILPKQTLPGRVRDVAALVQERDREQREAGRREGAFLLHGAWGEWCGRVADGEEPDIPNPEALLAEQGGQSASLLHEFESLGFTRGPGPLPSGTEILKCVHCGAQATGDGNGNLGDSWTNSECPKRDKEEP